ncbi:hypothetical protein [Maricaulis sp.]|uniref:hypothetical protein n=1 Tax=Maricaulis sp. TaxID=1486257 RepID=UPI00260A6451|nr:hypothetical protein [Maricaulis sp.]
MRLFPALIFGLVLSLALAGGAFAAPPSEESSGSGGSSNRFLALFNIGGDETEEEEVEEPDDPRSFTMPAIVAPLSVNGRLTGFAYVVVRVRVAAGRDIWSIQENAHFALDALIRASHRHDLSAPGGQVLDEDVAVEVWSRVLSEVYGENALERVEIRGFDVRLIG